MLLNEPGFSFGVPNFFFVLRVHGRRRVVAGGGGGAYSSSARSTITLGRPSFPRFVPRCVTYTSIAAPTSHYKLCCGCSSLFFYLDSSLDASRGVCRRRRRRRYGASVSLPEPAVIVADANGELLVPRKNWTHAPNLTTFVECSGSTPTSKQQQIIIGMFSLNS